VEKVTKALAVIVIIAGLALAGLGLAVLPEDHGRFEYAIEIADPRPASQSTAPAALTALGAVRVLVLEPPAGGASTTRILATREQGLLTPTDCALGRLPRPGSREALAGAETGLERGWQAVAGHRLQIVGVLQPLGPVFDRSLVLAQTSPMGGELESEGWRGRASYLLLTSTWEERGRALARLEARPALLPTPEAEIVASARRPPLPRRARVMLAALLVSAGVLVMAAQLRGLTKGELSRRLSRR
jgi:hypothetical protein